MTNNQLSTQTQAGNGALSVYSNMKDPLEAVDRLGEWFQQSGMLAKNPGQARILALACMVRNEDPLKLLAENMIVDGKLTRKYQMLLVDLRNAGGDYEWIADGEDGKAATLQIVWKGKTHRYTFTMEMARRAGYIKPNGPWEKLPGNMLRSKCVRQCFDMHCPEVSSGYLTPEDVDDLRNPLPTGSGTPTAASTHQPPAPRETTAAEDAPFEVEGEVVMETQAQDTETATEPQSNGNGRVTRERMQELAGKARQLGMTGPQIKDRICKAANVSDPSEITMEQAAEIIAKLDAKMEEKVAAGN